MENTPNYHETLRQRFSRRASAARIAFRKLRRSPQPAPLTDKPSNVAIASPAFHETKHR